MKKEIKTENAPAAIGAYSQAVETEDFIFVSGQIPMEPNTGKIVDKNIKAQITQVLENIKGILNEIDLDMSDVVKSTIYLDDIENFNEANNIYKKYFNNKVLPARAAIEVSRLPKDVLVEIEVIAHK